MKQKRNLIILIAVIIVGIIGYEVIIHKSYTSKAGSFTVSNTREHIEIPGGSTKNKEYKCELEVNVESSESPDVVVKFLGDNDKEYYKENITAKGVSKINKTFKDVNGDLKIEIDSKNTNSNVSYSVKY